MSVKIMGMVWDLEIGHDEKLILLAYADHASHEGTNIFPAVSTIAKKTNYSERSVQVITRKLEDMGILVSDGKGPAGTNKWRIPISGEIIITAPTGGAETAPPQDEPGVKQLLHQGGAEYDKGGCSPQAQGGEAATAPDPSLTIIKPSNEPPLFNTDIKKIFLTFLHDTPLPKPWEETINKAPKKMNGTVLEVEIEDERIRESLNYKFQVLKKSIAIARFPFGFIELVAPPEKEGQDA